MGKPVDYTLTKKAHTKETFSEEQILDLQKCSNSDDGYLYFIKNFFYIQHPVQGKMMLNPYEYQERLLAGYHNYPYNVNICPRQSGKCVEKQTLIKIKHKKTGEIKEISIKDFFDSQKPNI